MHFNFTGRWRADLSASRLRGATPSEIVVSLTHVDPELRVDMTILAADNTTTRVGFDARTTGEAVTNIVAGSQWVSRSSWVGRELLIESHVSHSGRQMLFRDYWSLSDDGRRLTMEHRGDDLDGQVTVLDRIGDAD